MNGLTDLETVLRSAAESTGLPGAAVAVLYDGELTEAATGVLNLRTGVEVTTDSRPSVSCTSRPSLRRIGEW